MSTDPIELWRSKSELERGERTIEAAMERLRTPGVSIAVVCDQAIYARGLGVTSTDRSQAVPIAPDTVFRIGSTTKPLTGTLAMRLVEAGKIGLDEPVVHYLPWFRLSNARWTDKLTIRHLMSHQSGLPWGSEFFGNRESAWLEEFVRTRIPLMPLVAPPGTLFSYSNVGVNVLGCALEAAGGQPFAELMGEIVFNPLLMPRTTFDPLAAMSWPLAQPHRRADGEVRVVRDEPWAENVAYRPSAMAYSTVLDVAHLAKMLLASGQVNGVEFLAPSTLAEMHRTQVDEYLPDGRTVGLTFALSQYKGERRVGHGGGIGSFGSVFTMLPDRGIAVAMLFNEAGFWAATEEIVSVLFEDLLDRPPADPRVVDSGGIRPKSNRDLNSYVGHYLGTRVGLVEVSISEGALQIRRGQSPDVVPLELQRENVYVGQDPLSGEILALGLVPSEDPRPSHVMVNGAPCTRIQAEPGFQADPRHWEAFRGDYVGPDETYPRGQDRLSVRADEGSLRIFSRNRQREERAIPWSDACFIYRERLVRFQQINGQPSLTLGDPILVYTRIPAGPWS